MKMEINGTASLKALAAQLHDARFTADMVVFNPSSQTFTLKCWIFESDPNTDVISQLWKAYELVLTSVNDCKIEITEQVSYYELSTFCYSSQDSQLDIFTHYGFGIHLKVNKLEGYLTEMDETRKNWN